MNATKHTPGPWHTGTTANTKYSIYEQFGQQIAESFAGVFIGNHPSSAREANARLIAAAPELLAALKGMLEVFGDEFGIGDSSVCDDARAAIAKATGTDDEAR